jgi:hypothetical protein
MLSPKKRIKEFYLHHLCFFVETFSGFLLFFIPKNKYLIFPLLSSRVKLRGFNRSVYIFTAHLNIPLLILLLKLIKLCKNLAL